MSVEYASCKVVSYKVLNKQLCEHLIFLNKQIL